MKLSYNLTGEARKSLVSAISRALNAPTEYSGVPTFAYKVGEYTIDKTGTLTGPDSFDLEDALHQMGFDAIEGEYEEPEPAETAKPKRKGIMDTLVETLNENAVDGEHWERLHNTPQMECGDGRWRNLDGTFASTVPDFEGLRLTEREELGLGRERREDYQGENGMNTDDVPETITIEVPFASCTDLTKTKETLIALLQSKAALIQSALGEDAYWYTPEDEYTPKNNHGVPRRVGGWYGPAPRDNTLPIEFTENTVKFEWLRFGADSLTVSAWSAFLAAAVKFAKSAKRVTAKDTAVENEKFAFRTFLVKIGMNDITNKVHRKQLLKNLSGDAAFATPESKTKWQANQKAKKAEAAVDE